MIGRHQISHWTISTLNDVICERTLHTDFQSLKHSPERSFGSAYWVIQDVGLLRLHAYDSGEHGGRNEGGGWGDWERERDGARDKGLRDRKRSDENRESFLHMKISPTFTLVYTKRLLWYAPDDTHTHTNWQLQVQSSIADDSRNDKKERGKRVFPPECSERSTLFRRNKYIIDSTIDLPRIEPASTASLDKYANHWTTAKERRWSSFANGPQHKSDYHPKCGSPSAALLWPTRCRQNDDGTFRRSSS